MNKQVCISVILAAYNARAFICKAIEGILAQTFCDFELLIVDDGSTDGTDEICDEYASRDPRIRVFHEQHKGVAYTRQLALSHAQGEYLLYIDDDSLILCARTIQNI